MKSFKSRKKLYHWFHSSIGIFALSCVAILSILLMVIFLTQYSVSVSPKAYTIGFISIPLQTSLPSPTSIPIPVKTFTSPDLGIRFTYAASTDVNDGIPLNALEEGNKVYVYETDQKPENGMYIEIFSKDPQDSIIEAIKKRILRGYSTTNCVIQITDPLINPTTIKKYEPKSYQYAIITVPNWNQLDFTTLDTLAAHCPSPYTYIRNGNVYFLADSNHPTKLLFFYLGQSGISAGNPAVPQMGWQDTIQLLDHQ